MKKLTKNDIISLALESAAQIRVPPDQLTHFDTMYELIKNSTLKERPWLFTLTVTKDLRATEDGGNRGFKNKYRLPKDALSVLQLNPGQLIPFTVSPDIALTVGYNIDRHDRLSQLTRPRFIYVDGVLHTDIEVNEVIYKNDPPESQWSEDFALVVMWKLAEYIATTRSQKRELVAKARQQAREYTLKAIRPILEIGPSPVSEKSLQHWLDVYYRALYQQGV